MIDIEKIKLNDEYSMFDLMVLSFKLINKNIGTMIKCWIKSVLVIVMVMILGSMFMSITAIGLYGSEAEVFDKINQSMQMGQSVFTVLNADELIFYGLFVLAILISVYITMWLVIRDVIRIDTGIESIELSKVNVSTGKTFLKVLATQILIGIIALTLSSLLEMMPLLIYLFLFIQVQIFNYLINQYARFSYFEMMSKGKNIGDALSNASTNLFFSKNKLILKNVVGAILMMVAYIAIEVVILFGAILLVAMFISINNIFLGVLVGIGALLVFLITTWYYTFMDTTYNYLVYMLNEVRDDKVGNLR